MKKILIIGGFLLLYHITQAQIFKDGLFFEEARLPESDCDACGCSATGGSLGFNSLAEQNFIGLRWVHQQYRSRDGVFNDSPWINEHFSTLQLWSRIPIQDRIEISLLLPYHYLDRNGSKKDPIQGLGDINVIGFYKLFDKKPEEQNTSHQLFAGAGIKVPTGSFDAQNNGSVNPSFQLGTGSWDYTAALEYVTTVNRLGFNVNSSYIFKTENKKAYQFGNQFNYSGSVFYLFEDANIRWVPQAGIAGEIYSANKDFGEAVPLTKGEVLFGRLGLEAAYRNWIFGLQGMLPIQQNLTGGRVEAIRRWSLHLNYRL